MNDFHRLASIRWPELSFTELCRTLLWGAELKNVALSIAVMNMCKHEWERRGFPTLYITIGFLEGLKKLLP